MFTFDFSRLATIGLTSVLLQNLLQQARCDGTLFRVSAVHRDAVLLHDGEGSHLA